MKTARRSLLAAVLAIAALPARAAAFDLDALMALLATRKSGSARFTEERTVSTLDTPLQSSGTLTFTAPDRFARTTTEPRAESMEVQGNTVVLKRGGRTRQLQLDAVPELAALADGMRGVLAGDANALTRHFRTRVDGNAGRWVLTLRPIDSRLAAQVERLQIAGSGADVRSVELGLVGGDRSLMLLTPDTPAPASRIPR